MCVCVFMRESSIFFKLLRSANSNYILAEDLVIGVVSVKKVLYFDNNIL